MSSARTFYSASELIAAAKAALREDAHRMSARPEGMPRYAWRAATPITSQTSFIVRDTAFKTRPRRRLWLDVNGNPYDLWVWGNKHFIERIDLAADDANERLSRYEKD